MVTWGTPPLDFTGYRVHCYEMLDTLQENADSNEDESPEKERTNKDQQQGGGGGGKGLVLEELDLANKKEISDQTMGPEATEVVFQELKSDTIYFIQILTVHGEIENDAAEVAVKTEKTASKLGAHTKEYLSEKSVVLKW